MNEQEKVDGKLELRLSGIKPAKDRVEKKEKYCLKQLEHAFG